MHKLQCPGLGILYAIYRRYVFFLSRLGKRVHLEGADKCGLCLFTIAFNKEDLIAKQIELLRKYVIDRDYRYIVFDNSTDRKKRKSIELLCRNQGVEYHPIPAYLNKLLCPVFLRVATSHGAALNWVYYHFICFLKPERLAIIDHDVFPFAPICLKELLDGRDFYGVARIFNDYWYLWPGWCFYRLDAFSTNPNFLPVFMGKTFLDTGGGNYRHIYSRYELKKVEFPMVKMLRVKNTERLMNRIDIYHSDYVQIINRSWIHLINGSNYACIAGKERTNMEILLDIEQFNQFK